MTARPESMRALGIEVISNRRRVERLVAALFGDRHTPCIVLTAHAERRGPVLPLREVRQTVGADAAIFLVASYLLHYLYHPLGSRLAVPRGTARIFWPELTLRSDPFDHPLVSLIDVESVESALAEFARQFDLSRPHIRREIKLLDELHTSLEQTNGQLEAAVSRQRRELLDMTTRHPSPAARAEDSGQRHPPHIEGAGMTVDGRYESELDVFLRCVAGNVRRIRTAPGRELSQDQLAKLTRLDLHFIRDIEEGAVELRLSTLTILATALGVRMNDFILDAPIPRERKSDSSPYREVP